MKRIIEGKTYNTDTAVRICSLRCQCHPRDFSYHDTALYLSPRGQYFLAGVGEAASMWAQSTGQNSTSGGEGLKLIDKADAARHAEDAGLSEDEMLAAGFEVIEG